jgi:uncharacterized protein (DUF1330 family)
MKSVDKLVLVGVLGVIAGASTMEVLRAQTAAVPPAYVIANIEEVKDAAMLAEYGAAAPKIEAAFGGRLIVRGARPVMLDSSPLPKGTFVVIQFPSMKALQDWWNSPAYSAARPLREKSTVARLFAVEGIPPPE